MNAVVLLGHGSRANGVSEQMQHVAAVLAAHLRTMVVRPAHRELCEPRLESVVAELVAGGARRIVILPYFLHLGHHLQQDIPEQIETLRQSHPGIDLVLAEHLGFDERFVPVLEERVRAALGQAC